MSTLVSVHKCQSQRVYPMLPTGNQARKLPILYHASPWDLLDDFSIGSQVPDSPLKIRQKIGQSCTMPPPHSRKDHHHS
eukprot:jgi/Botrbrau1/21464/Bobra.0216s0072.1